MTLSALFSLCLSRILLSDTGAWFLYPGSAQSVAETAGTGADPRSFWRPHSFGILLRQVFIASSALTGLVNDCKRHLDFLVIRSVSL